MSIFYDFLQTTGFYLMTPGNAIMIVVGCVFIALAIIKDYEPLLLLPIGFGIIVGNIPFQADMSLGVYDDGGIVVTDGQVEIEDGSGSISITGAGGDVSINDGSGSITVRGVAGSVTVIDVSDIDDDLVIVDDGKKG